jgi:hypothetical protein
VHEVVEVAGGKSRAPRELPVRDTLLVHQALDGLAESFLAESASLCHYLGFLAEIGNI